MEDGVLEAVGPVEAEVDQIAVLDLLQGRLDALTAHLRLLVVIFVEFVDQRDVENCVIDSLHDDLARRCSSALGSRIFLNIEGDGSRCQLGLWRG